MSNCDFIPIKSDLVGYYDSLNMKYIEYTAVALLENFFSFLYVFVFNLRHFFVLAQTLKPLLKAFFTL